MSRLPGKKADGNKDKGRSNMFRDLAPHWLWEAGPKLPTRLTAVQCHKRIAPSSWSSNQRTCLKVCSTYLSVDCRPASCPAPASNKERRKNIPSLVAIKHKPHKCESSSVQSRPPVFHLEWAHTHQARNSLDASAVNLAPISGQIFHRNGLQAPMPQAAAALISLDLGRLFPPTKP